MEQLFKIIARGNDSDARAHRHLARFKIGKRRLLDALAQLFGRSNRPLGRRLSRQKHDEFLATIPRHHIALARILSQKLRKLPQNLVATLVAIYVVTSLKKVDVEHDHRQRALQTLRTDKLIMEKMLVIATVKDARQTVHLGHFFEFAVKHGAFQRNGRQVRDAAQPPDFIRTDDPGVKEIVRQDDAKHLVFEKNWNARKIFKRQKTPRQIVIRRLHAIDIKRLLRRDAVRDHIRQFKLNRIQRFHRAHFVQFQRKTKKLVRQMLRFRRLLTVSIQKTLEVQFLGFDSLPDTVGFLAIRRALAARHTKLVATIPGQKKHRPVKIQTIAVRDSRENDVQNLIQLYGLQHCLGDRKLKRQLLEERGSFLYCHRSLPIISFISPSPWCRLWPKVSLSATI